MIVPFATQSYKSKSLPISAQRCINAYAETQPEGMKTPVAIFGPPGIVSSITLGNGPVRGMWNMGGVLYVLSGGELYSVTSGAVSTDLGGSISGNGVVSLADNGTQLVIVNGVNGFVYSVALGFVLITDADFNAAKTVTFFDNYFVFDWLGTNKFFISASLDGTTYSALDFASAEVSPDLVLATINQQENLLVFGERTIETWYDSGNVNFPFNRYDGATIERGLGAARAVVKEDNSVFFLGNDIIFYRLNGIIPTRISTHALEAAWAQYPVTSDAFVFSYSWEGHKFIVLTFPTANATWVYDVATQLWHERVSSDANNNSYQRWRVNCYANCYGKHWVGDAFSGQIGYLDANTYTEFGNPIQMTLVGPVIHSDRKRIFMNKFELDVESGVGLSTGQGSNPQYMLDYSDDGGRTFSGPQIYESAGALGAYTKRLRWTRMGQSRNRCVRVIISDPVKRVIIANSVDLRPGSN